MKVQNAMSFFLILLVALSINACVAANPKFHVNVDSLSAAESSAGKRFILLPGNKDTNMHDLQFKEYASYINRALIAQGYNPSETFETADLAIFLSYGIGDPQEHQYSYSLPVFGQTGVSSANTFRTLNTYGNFGSYSSTTTFTPTYGIKGYTQHSGSYTIFFRFLLLSAYDLEVYRKQEKEVQVWKTTVTSSGSSGDLRRVFPILVAASRPYIGVNTGQQIKVILDETDQVVIDIKGVNTIKEQKK